MGNCNINEKKEDLLENNGIHFNRNKWSLFITFNF